MPQQWQKMLDTYLGTEVRATVDHISTEVEDSGLPAVKKKKVLFFKSATYPLRQ